MNNLPRYQFLFVLFVAALLTGCDQTEITDPSSEVSSPQVTSTPAASSASVQKGEPQSWSSQPLDSLWSYVAAGDSVVDVGLKEPSETEGVRGSDVLVSKRMRDRAVQNILRAVSTEIISEDKLLPIVQLKAKNKGVLQALRNMPFVEYVEPGYILGKREGGFFDGVGCSVDSYNGDIGTVSPGDKTPTELLDLGVKDAWRHSKGEDVEVAVVGTGISQYQPQFKDAFSDGRSGGRVIEKDYTWTEYDVSPRWHDDCGHETRVSGFIAAPRDGESVVGSAYKSDLYTVRVDDNVVTQTRAGAGATRYGIRRASKRSDIVNMAFGSATSWNSIEDEIEYWHDKEDALYIGAAGTSKNFSNGWVTFPASMSEVVAVTGLDPDGSPCNICHYDEEVMFAAEVNEPTVHPNKNGPVNPDGIVNADGASTSTGIISGIVALVRAQYPNYDRQQVIDQLVVASERSSKDGSIGWGQPDAYTAVGGMHNLQINGPYQAGSGESITLRASFDQGNGPFTYQWSNGQRGSSIEYVSYAASGQEITLYVTITDQSDGVSRQASRTISIVEGNGGGDGGGGGDPIGGECNVDRPCYIEAP
jgi:hypothetical protein